MGLTAEIRWFWPGIPPEEFRDWFVSAGPTWGAAGDSATRIDTYLSDTAHGSLGIKKRGGSGEVEIKGLVSRRESVLGVAGCHAHIELWAKWAARTLALKGRLICVEKRRWERAFETDSGVVYERDPCSADARGRSGCHAELTLLKGPDNAPWWTLGFEAFGALDEVEANLTLTVDVIGRRSPPRLQEGQPISYPCWFEARGWGQAACEML